MPLVLVTGPPGTGKSTLADAAALQLGAPVLAWDWVMAAMTGFEEIQRTFREMDPARYRSVGWSILHSLAVAQLRRGQSAVLDGVARDADIERTRRLAEDHGASALVIATGCSDRDLHRARVEGRRRDIPGWHELEWAHVERVLAGWSEPVDADVRLDAASPLGDNLALLHRSIVELE